MTNLEYNKQFITGGSTENYDVKAVDSFGREYQYVPVEQFFKDITGDNNK